MSQLNERFKQFLQQKGLSQTEFAQTTGYKEKSLSNFLTGRVKYPKVDLIDAIIKSYPELNLKWLFTGEGEMFDTLDNFDFSSEIESLKNENTELKDELIKAQNRIIELFDKLNNEHTNSN